MREGSQVTRLYIFLSRLGEAAAITYARLRGAREEVLKSGKSSGGAPAPKPVQPFVYFPAAVLIRVVLLLPLPDKVIEKGATMHASPGQEVCKTQPLSIVTYYRIDSQAFLSFAPLIS